MSHKNKILAKRFHRHGVLSARRAASANAERTPVSHIPAKVTSNILGNPKQKMNGSTRRRLQASRGLVVETPQRVANEPAIKVALKLQALPMVKLIRRLKQAARRASTCKHLLEALHAGSKYGPALRAEQSHQLCLAGQITAEISIRNHNTQH